MTRRDLLHRPAGRLVLGIGFLSLVVALAPLARGCAPTTDPVAGGETAAAADGDPSAPPDWAVKRAAELGGGVLPEDVMGPHVPRADLYNPDKREVKPALGGRIIAHLEAQPANLCYPIENSAVVTFMLREMHAALLRFNWETWQQDLELASGMDVEDTLILNGGPGADNSNIRFGKVEDGGDVWKLSSGSASNPIEPTTIPKSDVASLQRGTVFTFRLRPDVKWHDGHPFDANDVLFSVDLYNNPNVDCDEKRFRFLEIAKGEVLDPLTVRFFYKTQYYSAMETFNDTLCILPSHLYNLLDKDCKDYKPDATLEERGTYINDNPHNIDWVGLGPYKLTKWERGQYIEAERFKDYFEKDPRKAGYADVLRWRYIDNDDGAFQGLLNDEIDIFRRVKTEDYFGELTNSELFKSKFYKAYSYVGQYGYTCWNMYRSKFSDVRVRTALAYAFDNKGWVASKYMGLAVPVTGPAFFLSPAYDHGVQVLPYDPGKAEELLAEAGWYDRDGDGIVDRDGENMVIEFLMPSGNKASEALGQKLQESYAKVGVKVVVQPLEWASFLERMLNRDFDCCNLAWVIPELESDPKQIWHSEEAVFEKRSSNHAGYADPLSDQLIDKLRMELDADKRQDLWHQLHKRIYELQPYLFGQTPPTKFAFSKKLRGVKLYNFAPGYRMRDMYFEEGTPGTRPLTPASRN